MSSGPRCSASAMSSGGTRRVISFSSHARSAAASTSGRPVEVAPVGVDRADDHVVLQDDLLGHVGRGHPARGPAAADAGQADHPAGADLADRVDDDRPDAGALDDDVGLEAEVGDGTGVVGGTEVAHELRLRRPR